MKKLVSLIMVLMMFFSLLPISALAAEEGTSGPLSVEAENSMGTLLVNTLEESGAMPAASVCQIVNVRVNGTTAAVDYQTDRASGLVVAIYEKGTDKMLGSSHAAVSADTATAT